jgi:hypothetical protein
MVHEYQGYTTDIWVYTAWQYIPSGFTGQTYFLLLNTYNDGGPYNWSTQIMFDGGSMLVTSDPDGVTLPLTEGQWVQIRVEIDMVQDLQSVFYGGQLLIQKSWTDGVTGGGVLDIGAVDLYANGASPVYYDDLSLAPQNPTPVQNTTWGRLRHSYR